MFMGGARQNDDWKQLRLEALTNAVEDLELIIKYNSGMLTKFEPQRAQLTKDITKIEALLKTSTNEEKSTPAFSLGKAKVVDRM